MRRLYPDATGRRPVAYTEPAGAPWLAGSHAALVAALAGVEDDDHWRRAREGSRSRVEYLPGTMTPFPGIRLLTPNTCLDLDRSEVSRTWPRRSRGGDRNLGEVVEEAADLLRRQAGLLARGRRLALSLTGGLDSRITLASLREHPEAFLAFTIRDHRRVDDRDPDRAAEVCRGLGLRHLVVDLADPPPGAAQLRRRIRAAHAEHRGDERFAAALLHPELRGRVHVLSGASEIGRAFYRSIERRRRRRDLPEVPDDDVLARLFGDWSGNPIVRDEIAEFRTRVDLAAARRRGYDPYDLYYWESRSGAWAALNALDTDFVAETLVPFNNRRLLELLLAAPLEDRIRGRVHLGIVRRLAPEVAEIPIPERAPRPSRVVRRLQAAAARVAAWLGNTP